MRDGHILATKAIKAPAIKESGNISRFKNLAIKAGHIGFYEDEDCFLNMAGYYGYMETAYYISQEIETRGDNIHPTCREILDSAVVPIFLERVRLEGLPAPEYYITNGYFEPPAVVDPINPFMSRQSVVLKNGHQERVAKSMTRNFTYAICCQVLPPGAKIGSFRSVLGYCTKPLFETLSKEVWRIFRIPLAFIRVIILADGSLMLSRLQSLPFNKLTPAELKYLEDKIKWQI
jgi:hypothetical protein